MCFNWGLQGELYFKGVEMNLVLLLMKLLRRLKLGVKVWLISRIILETSKAFSLKMVLKWLLMDILLKN